MSSVACGLAPKLSFAELKSANNNFVNFSAMKFVCFLNVSLLSNIMHRYFRILHLKKRFVIQIYFKFFSFFSLSSCYKHYF